MKGSQKHDPIPYPDTSKYAKNTPLFSLGKKIRSFLYYTQYTIHKFSPRKTACCEPRRRVGLRNTSCMISISRVTEGSRSLSPSEPDRHGPLPRPGSKSSNPTDTRGIAATATRTAAPRPPHCCTLPRSTRTCRSCIFY